MERTGLEPEAIDTCMRLGAGHPLGPLALLDLVGLDVSAAIGRTIGADVPERIERMIAEGALGRKSGRGFYTYDGPELVVARDVLAERVFPAGVRGIASTKRTARRRLCGATRSATNAISSSASSVAARDHDAPLAPRRSARPAAPTTAHSATAGCVAEQRLELGRRDLQRVDLDQLLDRGRRRRRCRRRRCGRGRRCGPSRRRRSSPPSPRAGSGSPPSSAARAAAARRSATPQLGVRHQPPGTSRARCRRAVGDRAARRRLGQPVALADRRVREARGHGPLELGAERRAAADDQLDVGQVDAGAWMRRQQRASPAAAR